VNTDVTAALRPVEEGLFSEDPPALLAGRCASCGSLRFPRRAVCADCQGAEIEAVALSTTGTLYTFTIVRMSPPGYLGETPYAIGVVELPEGLRVSATITAGDLEGLQIGDDVAFELITLVGGDEPVLSYAFRRQEPAV
jgi:uncharacterized OB-fold protein